MKPLAPDNRSIYSPPYACGSWCTDLLILVLWASDGICFAGYFLLWIYAPLAGY